MNNIAKLGNLVHKFLEELDDLRIERDSAVKKTGKIEIELKKANETINEFEKNKSVIENPQENNVNSENKKREIINQIDLIIENIDNLNLGNITDV
ncbi:hypothetical protein ACFL50_00790 [Candidatus Latescibacterota bacterium]